MNFIWIYMILYISYINISPICVSYNPNRNSRIILILLTSWTCFINNRYNNIQDIFKISNIQDMAFIILFISL